MRWFTNLTTAGLNTDTDGDGLTDREEYILGTDPTHPNPGLTLQAHLASGSIELSFLAQAATGAGYQNAERHYCLESRTNLAGGDVWEPVSGFADRTIASGSETLVFSVSPPSTQSALFRVRIWLQQKQH